jgi:hypothetical protein
MAIELRFVGLGFSTAKKALLLLQVKTQYVRHVKGIAAYLGAVVERAPIIKV